MLYDTLANILSNINNAQQKGKSECEARPASQLAMQILAIMHDNHYIGKPELIEDRRGGSIKIPLLGAINKCGVIKPRFPVKTTGFERYEKRFLPAKDFGLIMVSTPKGIMTHLEAKKKKLGGVLLAYVY